MKLEKIKLEKLIITDAPSLDPIHVYTEDLGPGKGSLLVRCFDRAWYCYWGNMGTNKDGTPTTVRQFVLSCDTGYITNNLVRGNRGRISSATHQANDERHVERIAAAVQCAFKQQQPRTTTDRLARLQRLQHANDLIKAISEHGRRFFWSERDQRLARLEIDERGKLWWVDNYRGARVYIERVCGRERDHWRGFSHGGTLRHIAQMMRDYVKKGDRFSAWYIAQDCWWYEADEAAALLEKVKANPALNQR